MSSGYSTFQVETPNTLPADAGKTISSVEETQGHFYDVLGNTISVTRYTLTYTDGTFTIIDTPNGLRYASTSFIPGSPPSRGLVAYLDAIEKYPRSNRKTEANEEMDIY